MNPKAMLAPPLYPKGAGVYAAAKNKSIATEVAVERANDLAITV
jgi:hypothetical protein